MTRVGLYPGCSMPGSAREYGESLDAVSKKMGFELVQVPDWNCCGATAAHNLNHTLSLSLPARILALAEKAGLNELLVPCAACFNRLVMTNEELSKDKELKDKIVDIIELDYQGKVKVINIVSFLEKIMSGGLDNAVTAAFNYRAACYYGCLLVRPPKIVNFDRVEDPQIMDDIMKLIGAAPIDWSFKTECCGAGLSISKTDIVAELSEKIVRDAVNRGAEVIIVACPMCHTNLDMRRNKIEERAGKKYDIPVLYITQAIGLALGIGKEELGIHRHIVPVNLPQAGAADKGETASVKAEKEMEHV